MAGRGGVSISVPAHLTDRDKAMGRWRMRRMVKIDDYMIRRYISRHRINKSTLLAVVAVIHGINLFNSSWPVL